MKMLCLRCGDFRLRRVLLKYNHVTLGTGELIVNASGSVYIALGGVGHEHAVVGTVPGLGTPRPCCCQLVLQSPAAACPNRM